MPQHPTRCFAIGTLCCLVLTLSACARPDMLASRDLAPAGPPPVILPLDEVLAQADADATSGEPSADLAARAARLRARARALQDQARMPAT